MLESGVHPELFRTNQLRVHLTTFGVRPVNIGLRTQVSRRLLVITLRGLDIWFNLHRRSLCNSHSGTLSELYSSNNRRSPTNPLTDNLVNTEHLHLNFLLTNFFYRIFWPLICGLSPTLFSTFQRNSFRIFFTKDHG